MLARCSDRRSGQLEVAFALSRDGARLPASVVGDVNEWGPAAHTLRPLGNRAWSQVVSLDMGREYRLAHRSASGERFNHDEAEGGDPNQFASTNGVPRL